MNNLNKDNEWLQHLQSEGDYSLDDLLMGLEDEKGFTKFIQVIKHLFRRMKKDEKPRAVQRPLSSKNLIRYVSRTQKRAIRNA